MIAFNDPLLCSQSIVFKINSSSRLIAFNVVVEIENNKNNSAAFSIHNTTVKLLEDASACARGFSIHITTVKSLGTEGYICMCSRLLNFNIQVPIRRSN